MLLSLKRQYEGIIQLSIWALVVSLNLVPNFELNQKILMMGESVKVLKPIKLAKEIKKSLSLALKQYS